MVRWIRSAISFTAVFITLTVAFGSTTVCADTADAKAKALYREGMKAYDVGDFDRALGLYSDAYKLSQLPGFLFNIAQCHRLLGNYERAEFFFGRFIDNSKPAASNVDLATSLLAELKAKQAEKRAEEARRVEKEARDAEAAREEARKAAAAPKVSRLAPTGSELLPPPPPPPAVEEAPVYKKWWFWTVVGVGVAGVAAGSTAAVVSGSQPKALPTTLEPIGSPH